MKKLLIFIIFIPLLTRSQDAITNAIKKSDPELVKKAISKRTSAGNLFTLEDRHFYINFCDEVITRRRNAIQFPQYSDGQPVYTKAFTSDEDPSISINCGLRGIIGIIGTIIALPYCFPSITDYYSNDLNHITGIAISAEIISLSLLLSFIIEVNIKRKKHQEELYENAIEIKHLFINLENTITSLNSLTKSKDILCKN